MLDIFISLFILLVSYYVYFLLRVYSGIGKISRTGNSVDLGYYVSIIIPFRNESENLVKSLRSVEEQNFPKDQFEVIYVNDSSEDNSLEILEKANKSNNVKILNVPRDFSFNAHKKRAIRYGIENSSGEIIITTDADCIHGKEWLKVMISAFNEKTGFVSGPVKFRDGRTVFDKLQKIEFAGLVLTGAGLIGNGSPIICNAANIAYKREVYYEVNGFNDQMNLSSGDDELLMQKIRKNTDYKIKFCWDKNALVETEANKSVNQFYQQRKRWASKGLFYADKLLILKLVTIFIFYLGLPVQAIFAFTWNMNFIFTFLISFALKIIIEYRIIKKGNEFLLSPEDMNYFYLAELLHIPYIIISGVSGLFGNYTWKQRKVKR